MGSGSSCSTEHPCSTDRLFNRCGMRFEPSSDDITKESAVITDVHGIISYFISHLSTPTHEGYAVVTAERTPYVKHVFKLVKDNLTTYRYMHVKIKKQHSTISIYADHVNAFAPDDVHEQT